MGKSYIWFKRVSRSTSHLICRSQEGQNSTYRRIFSVMLMIALSLSRGTLVSKTCNVCSLLYMSLMALLRDAAIMIRSVLQAKRCFSARRVSERKAKRFSQVGILPESGSISCGREWSHGTMAFLVIIDFSISSAANRECFTVHFMLLALLLISVASSD